MKIWIIHQHAIPPSLPGQTRHNTLASELISRGHEVTVFCSNFSHTNLTEITPMNGKLTCRTLVEGVPFQWISTPTYRGNSVWRLRNMLSFGRRLYKVGYTLVKTGEIPRPDVIFGSTPSLFSARGAERLARRLRVPFVLEVRDLWPQTLIDLGKFSAMHPLVWVMAKIERHLYAKAVRIVTVLPGAKNYMKTRGVREDHVTYIPNGIDLRMVPTCPPPQDSSVFTVIYAGAHGVPNGVGTILDAAALLQNRTDIPEIKFRLVGDGRIKSQLQQKARDLNLRNVTFEPSVPKNKVHSILSSADCLVVTLLDSPLYRFGMSLNKLYDYFSVARPIVFGAKVELNPVEESQSGITVPPESPEKMAEAIITLAKMSPEQRREMGLRGRRYVEEHHDFHKLGERLESVLLEVVHENQSVLK